MDAASPDASPLVDTEIYRRWRSAEIDELELCMWSADMFMYGISTSYESYGSLKTAIRRGVPDLLKNYIWIKANGADRFYVEHPNFYKHSFATTFGKHVPQSMGHDCPTFCGGILGLQSDIVGAPVQAQDIDFDSGSIDAESLTDSINTWHRLGEPRYTSDYEYDTGDDEPLSREMSVTSLRDFYQPRKANHPYRMSPSVDGVITPRRGGRRNLNERSSFGLPDVIEEHSVLDRRDPLDNYLSALHEDSHNQVMLLKTTKQKIHERRISPPTINTSQMRHRQYSDTLLLSSSTPLPNAPLHHTKIIPDNMSPMMGNLGSPNYPDTASIIKYLRELESKRAGLKDDQFVKRRFAIGEFLRNMFLRCGMRKHCGKGTTLVSSGSSCSESSELVDTSFHGAGYQMDGCGNKLEEAETSANSEHHVSFSNVVRIASFQGESVSREASIRSDDKPTSNESGYIRFPSTKVDSVLVRQATTMVFQNSVYKLSDVTDFTELLTTSGVDEVKRIMWCLNTAFSSKVEFLPMIPSLCCLLMVYMTPDATLCVLHCLMARAVESRGMECGERFLFVDREGFVDFVIYVHSVMRYHMRKLVSKLQLLNVDLAAWIARSVQSVFSHMLPFDFILRIFGDFIFEGEIVLCRYCIALVNHAHDTLIKCNSREEAEEALYHIGLDRSLKLDNLTKLAYSFRLKYYKSEASGCAITPYLMPVKIKAFYRPRMSAFSTIVKEHTWEVIWSWLLPGYRILDPHHVYSSDRHGTTMLGLVKTIKESNVSGVAALLFIETTTADVFGVFIPVLNSEPVDGLFTTQRTADYLDSFVFTLKPEAHVYKCTGSNNTGVKLGLQQIVVGNDMPALILDKNMTTGLSQCCQSYDSPKLVSTHDGYFDVQRIELWQLI
ncbi:rab GTPase, putative [Babesia ovis]|uniref:Rab GTPase, putative n=1 Tax=Babesia ovis TaxID=5869 RepID=A0A9W5TEB8_BABOV|nr:rab GTPase, putative [Babesia ovis]